MAGNAGETYAAVYWRENLEVQAEGKGPAIQGGPAGGRARGGWWSTRGTCAPATPTPHSPPL